MEDIDLDEGLGRSSEGCYFGERMVGSGPMPQKDLLQKIAYQSYSRRPTKQIGNLTLVSYTPTLKIYRASDNTFVVGIRGTESKQDIKADSLLAVGQLEQSARYKDDAAALQRFQSYYPPSQYDYYGVGHSLGGAILDVFLEKGMLKNGVSYNPAIQPQSLSSNSTSNERIYAENDPLYKLFGDKLLVKPEVRKRKEKSIFESVVSAIPYAGKVYDLFQGHTLGQFEGGNICLTKSAFVKEHKKLIGLLEKAGKEGKEQKKELQRVMKK